MERGQGNEGGHTRGGSPRTSTASKVEAGGGKGLACKKKKVHTEHNETGRGDPGTGGGLHLYPTGIGETLEFFLQQRSILNK